MKRKHHNVNQRTPEWLQLRLGRFTGSTADALTKRPRKKSDVLASATKTLAFEKMYERLSGAPIERYVSKAMQWGIDREIDAVAAIEQLMETRIIECGFYTLGEHMGASPDGILHGTVDAPETIVEIKCPFNGVNHIAHMVDEIPPAYYAQMQWNMAVTGAMKCLFVSFDPRVPSPHNVHFEHVAYDADVVDTMMETVEMATTWMAEKLAEHAL